MTPLTDLDTPALLVDHNRLTQNIAAMQTLADRCGVNLRPHTKTHKTPEIAHLQLAAGAQGITVAKPGEAEVMVAAGCTDLFIAYPLVGAAKYRRLLPLLERARIAVAADSAEGVAALSAFFGAQGVRLPVLVEVDTGFRRTGVAGAAAALALAQAIDRAPGLVFDGLMEFGGRAYQAADPAERQAIGTAEGTQIAAVAAHLVAAGLPPRVVSVGSTPSMPAVATVPGPTEVRPGVYVFGDRMQVALGTMRREECALTVLATVVSRPAPDRVVLDCGTKALSGDRDAAGSYGELLAFPGALLTRASEEHGIVEGPLLPLHVGDQVQVIPAHACATCNMHDELIVVAAGTVETIWRVAGRGRFR